MTDDRSESKKNEVRRYFGDASLPDFGVDSRFFPAMGNRLVELSRVAPGTRVLDVAAGRGASLFPAAERAGKTGEVIGIDLAEGMVQATEREICERKLRNASIRLMDAERLDFESGYFDRVLCGFALFFMPRLENALAEFHRVLKPGGAVAASTFGKDDEQFQWYEALIARYGISRQVPLARQLNSPDELKHAFREVGFSSVRVLEERFYSEYADEDDWWSHLWSTADGTVLAAMSEENRRALRTEAFVQIRALEQDGKIRVPYHVLFTLAVARV